MLARFWIASALAFLFLTLDGGDSLMAGQVVSQGRGEAVLLQDHRRAVVRLPDGDRIRLPTHPAVRWTALAVTRQGWAAAGTRSTSRGRVVVVLVDEGRGIRKLALPDPEPGTVRDEPQLLVREGGLEGVLWLEGTHRGSLAVRSVSWDAQAWGPVLTVSPPGAGSQLALTAVVLADGTWLAAWSLFDGEDDEVVWSWRRDESWSQPRRVDAENRVPDITPSLVAVDEGAYLAWSRYDGNDYRVHLARLRDGSWGAPRVVGEAGSLEPRMRRGRGGRGAELLYQTVRPRGWTLLELDSQGAPRRRAAVDVERTAAVAQLWRQEPWVSDERGPSVTFSWPATGHDLTADWDVLP